MTGYRQLLISTLVTMTCNSVILPQDTQPTVDRDRIERRILALAEHGKNPQGGVSRVAFSAADIEGRDYLASLMAEAGLSVHIDAAGNLIGRREGRNPDLAPIMFGSHADSVPEGGNYDGPVGVIAAIECVQVIHELELRTEHPLEVIVFSDEEGGLVGSRALIGHLSQQALNVLSHSGLSIAEGIEAIGGNVLALAEIVRQEGDLKAFIELHIEQGAVLDDADLDIGIVEGIVGIKWWDVTIDGMANHAGTTPMDKRRDALVAASHYVLAVNRIVTSVPGSQVGTVGKILSEPGAHNVIPGRVRTSLEIRDLSEAKIDMLFARIEEAAAKIATDTGTSISFELLDVTAQPAMMDAKIRQTIADAAQALGLSSKSMPSGAGHDAQDMARIAPTGMIFVPSRGGISHSPEEFTSADDMAKGASVLLQTVLRIDAGALNTKNR